MREMSSTLLSLALTAVFAIVGGAIGGVLHERWRRPTPQIAVIDMQKLVAEVATDPSLGEAARRARVEDIGDRVIRAAEERAGQGIVVLDASAVVRAPGEVYVAP